MSGFNFKRLGINGQSNYAVGLGRNRATIASVTRPYKHLAQTNSSIDSINILFGLNKIREVNQEVKQDLNNNISNNIPEPPIILNSTSTTNQITINFINGINITNYLYSIDNGITYISANTTNSPIIINGLTSNTTYNIRVKSVNSNGTSNESRLLTITTQQDIIPTPNITPLAPVITNVTFKTTDSITLTFTQETNSSTITNYKYSIDNGVTYIAFSPVDKVSPVTIGGLTSGTTYNIKLRATSAEGDGAESNVWTETTYANVNYVAFTDVGASTWTAPEDVTFVQYLVVGAGGGGGATYSDILVLGNVPFVTSAPSPTSYWINANPGSFYGYFFRGGMTNTLNKFTRINVSQNIIPNGTNYPYNRWYQGELVYFMNSSFPLTSNYVPPYNINSTQCNNDSGGSGGGSGGQVKVLTGTNKYTVIPGNTYTITVGAGGQGGIGGSGTETNGSPGQDSSFDTITSLGGSGGGFSRNMSQVQDTNKWGKGGNGGVGYGNLVGGSGGGQTSSNNYGRYNSGGPGSMGSYINFDGTPTFYGSGGNGGVPNTVATNITPSNIGKGGSGTGATLNNYANGMNGGSGIVILKYYTSVITKPPVLTYSTFTNVGTTSWTAPSNVRSVEYLVVGGGGGSGATHDGGSAGGGGGGMVLTGTLNVNPNEVYTIIVGDGGDGGISYSNASPGPGGIRETDGSDGENSQFATISALGGGGGYRSRFNGTGVGGNIVTISTVASTGGYGGTFNNGGGGGGGNLSNGSNGVVGSTRTGGAGGSGLSSDISGLITVYGAGGQGGKGQTNEDAIAGAVNTGNGAKGPGTSFSSQRSGAKGGSGIVILKYYT